MGKIKCSKVVKKESKKKCTVRPVDFLAWSPSNSGHLDEKKDKKNGKNKLSFAY